MSESTSCSSRTASNANTWAQIPGVERVAAAELIAESGTDMSVFKSDAHLSSWAGVCPGNHESARRNRSGRHRSGKPHLTSALVEAAQSAIRKKKSYFRDKFARLKARRGYKRALPAIARKILVAAYKMLSLGVDYRDLGEAYLDQLDKKQVSRNLVRRLERLAYAVQLQPAKSASARLPSTVFYFHTDQPQSTEVLTAAGEIPEGSLPSTSRRERRRIRPAAPCKG